MNLDNSTNVEELQRRVQLLVARNNNLEQLVQDQFRGDPSTLNHFAQNYGYSLAQGYPLTSYGGSSARSSGLSRSKSTISYPTQIKSAITERNVGLQAPRRERRALSQQSSVTVPMSRSMSTQSESHMPFSQTGNRIAPLNPSIGRFCASQDEPANQSLQAAPKQLPSVQENQPLTIGMDPGDFLEMYTEIPQSSQQFDSSLSNFSYNMASTNALSSLSSSLSSNVPCSYPLSSACPSMISGPSVTEAASPLTRQNSALDFGVPMATMESSQSYIDGIPAPDLSPCSTNLYPTSKQYTPEHDLIGLGANLSSTAATQQWATANKSSLLSSPESADMERSASNTSISSVRSNASNLERRAAEARVRVLQSAKTLQLAPKPKEETTKAEANSTATKKEAKVPVNKSSYQRPKHPKVHCTQCNEHPDGFRGDHELRRHINAKHEGFVKKFVCRDPATVGIKSNVKAVNPLSKCKACTSGKEYGAYYNAAAHLRRTHFKPKTPRGKKGANGDEKRGGKGGGDWPPMSELKAWFVEKTVEVGQNESPITDQDEGDSDMIDAEMEGSNLPNQMEMYGIGSSMSPYVETNYDLALEGADPSMLAGANGELSIQAPISSAGSFGYSPFSDGSPLVALSDNYAFSDQGASAYGSNLSSTNTITPTTYQEISQLGISEGVQWA
ncbi:hypothetical protein CEP54_007711 [Fusarium duplospermum]|uniref:DUF7896 domain-containing protein n=1 Tax=Fusarium duplospermum TaxID=1325734 RepID=A0A428Q036_9HYPO|nr:hypothetical protein CEP54_007711 [Fusarium duplospermum]